MTTSPKDRVLARLQSVRSGASGHTARCPAHADDHSSLSIGEGDDGRVLLKCFAGCSVEEVVRALSFELADLFPTPPAARSEGPGPRLAVVPVSVEALARDKALPADFLRSLGLKERETGVLIPYRDRDGTPAARHRFRRALIAKQGSSWLRGEGLIVPYGLDRLPAAQAAGYLDLVEGESDCWTLWFHEFPALGIPGADMVNTLQLGHLEGIPRIYVMREPGKGGDTFVTRVPRRLAEIGWTGTLLEIRLPNAKDPNDLHSQDPAGFRSAFQLALDTARPVRPPEPLEIETQPADEATDTVHWPDPPAPDAFHGLAGDLVRLIAPHSEADPVALLVQILVAFGNIIGRQAYFRVEADQHFMNLFVVIVGASSKARKGTSWGHVKRLFGQIEEHWTMDCVVDGLSSGEGLIWAVRDPITHMEPVEDKETGDVLDYREKVDDQGVADKRLMVTESEFASILKVLNREGNTLSPLIRRAWDCGDLRTLTKNSPARATGAHIAIIGHITRDELRRHLSTTEAGNGFANRFLWVCARRSRLLPEGGQLHEVDLGPIQRRLAAAVKFASEVGEMHRDEAARVAWRTVYPDLSEGVPGLVGAVTSRSEAQVTRLACIYALLDCSPVVRGIHLRAALALWEYAESSARFIFGEALGDPVADELLQALCSRPEGMTRTEIRDHFGRNRKADEIGRVLAVLAEHGLAQPVGEESGGRPVERWFATRHLPPPNIGATREGKE